MSNFDMEGFYAALDAFRASKKLTWKQVAGETGIAASTLTRMRQGKRPDVDGLAALANWSGIDVSNFYLSDLESKPKKETLAEITTLLRADRNLNKESAVALEQMLKSAYEHMRDKDGEEE